MKVLHHICARNKIGSEFTGKENSGLRTHFGNGRNQIRRGTAKQQEADCSGVMSRLKEEKTAAGGGTSVQRSCGKSSSIPVKTKNIPISNSTEIRCDSMSPVVMGKLSRLSNCINGERTAISTINRSTIFGVLRCIVFAAASWTAPVAGVLRLW